MKLLVMISILFTSLSYAAQPSSSQQDTVEKLIKNAFALACRSGTKFDVSSLNALKLHIPASGTKLVDANCGTKTRFIYSHDMKSVRELGNHLAMVCSSEITGLKKVKNNYEFEDYVHTNHKVSIIGDRMIFLEMISLSSECSE